VAEKHTQDNHGKEGLHEEPEAAQDALSIAHPDAAPDQEVQQLSIVPRLPQSK